MKIKIIHGVNLNFTGIRETDVYGNKNLDDINSIIKKEGEALGFQISFFQSNHEGEIVDCIQSCYYDNYDYIIINPGAFTHYSYAIRDAIQSVSERIKTIEVHMSNVYSREEFRKHSVISDICTGKISGFGYTGYIMALQYVKLNQYKEGENKQ